MTERMLKIIIDLQTQNGDALGQIGKDMAGLGASAKQASGGLGQMGSSLNGAIAGAFGLNLSLAGLAAGGVALTGAMANLGMQFEQTELAFTTLLGSGEKAKVFLDELRDFAAATPFQFSDLTEASRKMMAFGFAAEEILPMLTDIGDAVAAMGGNSAMIDRVTLALGQMQAKSKVSAGEMLQLTEAGIPAWQYLADAMGLSTAEVMKLSEKGLIPAGQAIDDILAGMRQDFGGMMAVQAETAAGRMSTLNDKLEALGTTIGTKLLPATNLVIDTLSAAADTTTILAIASDTITAAYHEQATAVEQSARNYREYVEQIAILTDGEREHYLALIDSGAAVTEKGDSIEYLAQLYGIYTEAEFEAVKAQQAADQAYADAAPLREEFNRIIQSNITANQQLAESNDAVITSLTNVNGAMDLLKLTMAGAVGKENEEFKKSQDELIKKGDELKTKIEELEGKHWLTAAQKQELDDTRQALKDNNVAIEENAAKHEEATARILFGYAQQALAADGLTQTEIIALSTLAHSWGLVDASTQTAALNVMGAAQQLNEDGDLPAFIDTVNRARDAANNLGGSINNLPTSHTITITTNYVTQGAIGGGAGGSGTVGGGNVAYADGGYVPEGTAGIWNENPLTRPETFVAAQSGYILTRQEAQEALAGAAGRSGPQYHLTINNYGGSPDIPASFRQMEAAVGE